MKNLVIALLFSATFILSSCWNSNPPVVDIPESDPIVENSPSPTTPSPQVAVQVAKLTMNAKIDGKEWLGKSAFNPPPYYSKGSRAMQSPDRPVFKMGFLADDNSSLSYDLYGELKVGTYAWENLDVVYQSTDMMYTHGNLYKQMSNDLKVEITEFFPDGNRATVSGKISGSIANRDGKSVMIDGSFEKAIIDVWWDEAR